MTIHKPKVACFDCRFIKPIIKLGIQVHKDGTPIRLNSPFRKRRVITRQSDICPMCRKVMKEIQTTIKIPKKRDMQGWEKLEADSDKYFSQKFNHS